jgi:hypothetical protein
MTPQRPQPAVDAADADAELARHLMRGGDPASGLAAAVRAQLGRARVAPAWALAAGMQSLGRPDLCDLGAGLVAAHRGAHALAWQHWSTLADPILGQHVGVEAVRTLLVLADDLGADGQARLLAVVNALPADVDVMLTVAGHLIAAGRHTDAAALLARVDLVGAAQSLTPRQRRTRSVLGGAPSDRTSAVTEPAGVPHDAVVWGVMDYAQPDQDRASRNIGDHVQTVAMLGHLVRFERLQYSGSDGLPQVARLLAERVPSRLRASGPAKEVHLLPVQRDASSLQSLPTPTWLIGFGWHMHPWYGFHFDFPYHPNVRPVFVSFHVNRPRMLTDDAIAYLRRYGPVGCRDWSTVDLLASAGVPAFFTGCLTTTVDGAIGDGPRAAVAHLGLVDPAPRTLRTVAEPYELVSHRDHRMLERSVGDGIADAVATLEGYRSRFTRIVTSRLHCYLPSVALGVDVTFEPKSVADPRYPGLLGMRPRAPRLRRMQRDIRELLHPIIELIVSGAQEDEVYGAWRAATLPRVARDANRPLPAPHLDRERRSRTQLTPRASADSAREVGSAAAVVIHVRAGEEVQAAVTVHSLRAATPGPLRVVVVTAEPEPDYVTWVRRWADLEVLDLSCTELATAAVDPFAEATLSLPDVLPQFDRALLLRSGVVVQSDVTPLVWGDLAGRAVAGRPSRRIWDQVVQRVTGRLPRPLATELRALATRRYRFGFAAMDAGVVTLDLTQLRGPDSAAEIHGWVRRYDLRADEALQFLAGSDYHALSPAWNAWPGLESLAGPRVMQFLPPIRPWEDLLAPAQDAWREHANALAAQEWPPPRLRGPLRPVGE